MSELPTLNIVSFTSLSWLLGYFLLGRGWVIWLLSSGVDGYVLLASMWVHCSPFEVEGGLVGDSQQGGGGGLCSSLWGSGFHGYSPLGERVDILVYSPWWEWVGYWVTPLWGKGWIMFFLLWNWVSK